MNNILTESSVYPNENNGMKNIVAVILRLILGRKITRDYLRNWRRAQ